VKRSAAVIAAFLSLVAPVRSAAGAPSDDVATSQRVFEVVIAGSADDTQTLRSSLQELVRRLGLQMRVTTIDRLDPAAPPRFSADRDVVLRAWIDLRSSDSAIVMLSDPKSNRPVRSRQVARQGSRGLFLEEVAYVTHVGAESLLAGESSDDEPRKPAAEPTMTMEVKKAAPPEPAAPAPENLPSGERDEASASAPRTAKDLQINLATFATAEPFVKQAGLVFGGGLGAQIVLSKNASVPTFWLLGEYHLPFGSGSGDPPLPPFELSAYVWSLRIVPTWQLVKGRRILVEGGVGGGADVFVVYPASGAAQVPGVLSVNGDRTDVSPILTASISMHVLIGPRLTAFASGLVDGDLTPRLYVSEQGGTHHSMLQTRVPRPGFALGFSFGLLDGSGS
jgi:hypothetical protein